MQRYGLASLVKVGLCAMLALGAVAQLQADDKPNVVGSWTWENPARNNRPPAVSTLKLKMDGDKLVGTISRPGGRRGRAANADAGTAPPPAPAMTEIKLEHVMLKGDELSFSMTNPGRGGGDPVVAKYMGKVKGDMIEGKIEVEGQDPRDWKAKRAVDKPAAPAEPAKP